jgi:ribose transport system substrate-binding protein
MKKKLLLVICVIMLVSIISSSFTASAKQSKKIVVGFSALTLGNSWNAQTYASLKVAVARHPEIEKIAFANSNADPNTQINDIMNMIAQKVDVILIEASSMTALNPAMKKATAAGIPVVVADSLVTSEQVTSQVAPDEREWGKQTAKWLVDKLGGSGNIVVLNGIAGNSSNTSRWGGAEAVFNQNKNIKILAEANCNWDQAMAQPVVANWLAAYPKIDGVWSQGGAMTAAAILEFQKAKRPLVPMVGEAYNGFVRLWDENASSGFSSIACVLPNYDIQIALELALQAKKGIKVPKFINVPLTLITDATVNNYYKKDKPDDYWMVNDMEPAQIKNVISKYGQEKALY